MHLIMITDAPFEDTNSFIGWLKAKYSRGLNNLIAREIKIWDLTFPEEIESEMVNDVMKYSNSGPLNEVGEGLKSIGKIYGMKESTKPAKTTGEVFDWDVHTIVIGKVEDKMKDGKELV